MPTAVPRLDPKTWEMRKYTPPDWTWHLSQMPIAAKTAIKIKPIAAKTIKAACPIPASATIHPDRRKTMTPKMLIRHDVKTPSHVPNRTRSETKKCDSHQGWALDPCKFNVRSFDIHLKILQKLPSVPTFTRPKNREILLITFFWHTFPKFP